MDPAKRFGIPRHAGSVLVSSPAVLYSFGLYLRVSVKAMYSLPLRVFVLRLSFNFIVFSSVLDSTMSHIVTTQIHPHGHAHKDNSLLE